MRGDALLGDAERGQSVEHRQGGCLVGSAVVQAVQDVAMEINEAHAEMAGVAQPDTSYNAASGSKCPTSLPGEIVRVRSKGARVTGQRIVHGSG